MLIACFNGLLFYEYGAYGWTWLAKVQMYREKVVARHARPQQSRVGGGVITYPPPPPPLALSKIDKYVDLSDKYIYVNLPDTYVE